MIFVEDEITPMVDEIDAILYEWLAWFGGLKMAHEAKPVATDLGACASQIATRKKSRTLSLHIS